MLTGSKDVAHQRPTGNRNKTPPGETGAGGDVPEDRDGIQGQKRAPSFPGAHSFGQGLTLFKGYSGDLKNSPCSRRRIIL